MSFRLPFAFLLLFGADRLFGQSITGFTPNVGAPGDQIVIIGSGFLAGSITVRFWSNKVVTVDSVTDDSHITATVPASATTGPVSVQSGSGPINYSPTDFTVIGTGPYITGFSPTYGVPGDPNSISIYGVHFTGATAVRFSGASATFSVASQAGTNITAYVPASAPLGPGPISVTTPSGTSNSPTSFVVVGPGPYITGFSNWWGNVGDAVTISGVHFASATAVQFNGVSASFTPPSTDTSLTAFVPGGAATGPITVFNGSGSYTTSSNFFMQPQLTGFSPFNGRAGTNVVIAGKNFTGATNVTFNGLTAASFNINSSTQIVAIVPVNATTGPIRVYAPGAGPNPPSSNFVVLPTIFGFSPGFGPVGAAVTITGANFNVSGLTVKFFSNVTASVSSFSFGQISNLVPAGAQTGPITVSTADGTSVSAQNFYLPVAITGFSPTNSAPSTTVTISGQNLLGATNVTFNGTPANFVPPTNNTSLQATVPDGVITGPISLSTPAGTTNSGNLFFYGAPVITGFNPAHGFPGTNVIISGSNFLGATAVSFNGVPASFVPPANNTNLQATVPTNNVLTGPIRVIAPAGTATSVSNFILDFTSDLAVSLTGSPNPVFVGSNLVYTIFITNSGPYAAPGVVLNDTLPASVNLQSAATTLGVLNTNGNPIIGALGTMGVSNSAIVTLTVSPQALGTITNSVSVASGYSDPNPLNNSAAVTTTFLPLPLLAIQPYSADQVMVSWPAALNGYFSLQFTPGLGPNDNWSNLTTPPIISGTQSIVIDPDTAPSRFYRLKQ